MLNTNELYINQTFKNYKFLCEFLGQPVKVGKGKQLQWKEWVVHCMFHLADK